MSKYTTGEMAKLCDITVRTVQYYDTRRILVPSELSEGGRRLYSEEDLRKLKIICFLRELDLPINSIGELMREEDPESVISLILEQQKKQLQEELHEREERLGKLEALSEGLKKVEHFSVESIGDIAYLMKTKKQLTKVCQLEWGVSVQVCIPRSGYVCPYCRSRIRSAQRESQHFEKRSRRQRVGGRS